jgi:hypothetical protein
MRYRRDIKSGRHEKGTNLSSRQKLGKRGDGRDTCR